MANMEGFAQPWLNFEKQIGKRLLLQAGTPEEVNAQYLGFGGLLVTKLSFPPPDPSVSAVDREIFPGVKARIYTHSNLIPDSKPACVFFHGGGWVMGDLEGEDTYCRRICRDVGIVVVSVDYRLAPKHPFPIPLDDCVASCYWALENSDFLKTKPGKIIVSGTSAGANLALAAVLKLNGAGKCDAIQGVIAVVPPTIAPKAVPESLKKKYTSYDEHAQHTVNTAPAMKMFLDAYGADPEDPYVSVLLHPKLEGLPPVYTAVCCQDTLRDDGRLFRDALNDTGVANKYDEYEGYPHFFWGYPSEYLAEPIALFHNNLNKGFEFVLESKPKMSRI